MRRIGNGVEEDKNGAGEEDGDGEEDDGVEEDRNGTGQEDDDGGGEEDDGVEEDTASGHGLMDLRRRGILGVGRRFGGRHRELENFSKCQRAQGIELFYRLGLLLPAQYDHRQ